MQSDSRLMWRYAASVLMVATLVFGLELAIPGIGQAQSEELAEIDDEQEDFVGVEEIVVKGRRRDELLMKTPISIRAFGAQVLFQELVRVMGLAFAPVMLSVFVAIAPLAIPFGVLSLSMAFLFAHVAVQQTSGVTSREAAIANLAGFATFLVFMGAFANIAEAGFFGGLAPGILFFSLN